MFRHELKVGLVLGVLGMLLVGLTGVQSGANAAPTNDDFAKATIIKGKSSSIDGTNIGATKEAGEPDPGDSDGYSVWYRWRAPASGGVTFTSTGNFASVLGVYTGTYVNELTSQTEFRYGGGTDTLTVTFNAIAGTTYYVLVDDYYSATGDFTLSWQYGPSNDNFAHATAVSGKTFKAKGTNVNSSWESGEPDPGDSYGHSVWYRWKAPVSGGVTITSTGDFASVVGIYTGDYVDHLTSQTEFQSGWGTDTFSATFNAMIGTTYDIVVDDYYGATGTFQLTSVEGPINDNFEHPATVPGKTIKAKGTNVNSSWESGEPNPGASYGHSVWYRWTAPTNGGVTVTSTGDFASVVGVYTGTDVNALTSQTEFQSGWGTGTFSTTFNAIEGTTYDVVVDDYYGATGTFQLTSVEGPVNDNFAYATLVSGKTIKGTNVNSSWESGEPNPGESYGHSVWYKWQAPSSGSVTFTAKGDVLTSLGIYTGTSVSELTNQTQSRSGVGTTTSSATFNAVKDTFYYVLVDDYYGSTGKFTLSWQE